jgi:D-beta-D-heptose 7-phosphate kinase / D-beta-D-heptose 1-phosphate adenosyltransferase
MDSPKPPPASASTQAEVLKRLQELLPGADALVILESAEGLTSPDLIEAAQRAARSAGILLVGGAFGQAQFLRSYDVVLPNEREAAALVGLSLAREEALDEIGERLLTAYNNDTVAITRGARGISLFTRRGRTNVPAYEREVFDVAGAGDTMAAAFTVALLCGADPKRAADAANLAAYVAVGRSGTAVVTAEDVQHALVEQTTLRRGGKLRSRDELARIVALAKAQGKKVVFTNGCFDLIHPGHVSYLRQAADLGDILIVALNSDSSVQALKGPTRPILKQDERVMIMSALESVSWVTVFEETRITSLLDELRPDVWAKGGDYTLESLDQVERQMAESIGCRIALIPPVEGISTSDIVQRIEEGKRTVP